MSASEIFMQHTRFINLSPGWSLFRAKFGNNVADKGQLCRVSNTNHRKLGGKDLYVIAVARIICCTHLAVTNDDMWAIEAAVERKGAKKQTVYEWCSIVEERKRVSRDDVMYQEIWEMDRLSPVKCFLKTYEARKRVL